MKRKSLSIYTKLMFLLLILNFCRKINELNKNNPNAMSPHNSLSMYTISINTLSKKTNKIYTSKGAIIKLLIILSNDVHPNPGPKPQCGICHDSINQNSIKCATCKTTYHTACSKGKTKEDESKNNFTWICPKTDCQPNYYVESLGENETPTTPTRFALLKKTEVNQKKKTQPKKLQKNETQGNRRPKLNQKTLLDELTQITTADYVGKDWCVYCFKSIEPRESYNHCSECNKSIHRKCQKKMRLLENPPKNICRTESCLIINTTRLKDKESPEKIEEIRKSPDEFIIINMNSRNVTNKLEELEYICEKVKPDIICITESWMDESVPENGFIPTGYNIIRKDRSKAFKKKYNKTSGGGIAIIFKNNMNVERKTYLSEKVEEILWVQPKIKEPFLLGLLYKPEYSDMLESRKESENEESILENNVRKATQVSNRLIICGDFNIDMKSPNNPKTKQLTNMYETYQLKQYIKKPTRVDPRSGTASIIDHIWATEEAPPIVRSGTFIGLSDHFATYATMNVTREVIVDEKLKIRSYKNYNQEEYQQDLKNKIAENQKLNEFFSEKDVNGATDELIKTLKDVIDVHAPTKVISTKFFQQKIPWFNNVLKDKIAYKNQLLEDRRLYGSKCFNNKIKEISNEIHYLKRKLKKRYVTEKLDENEGNPKSYWKLINDLLFRGKPKKSIEPDMITQEKANQINKFFATIGTEIQKALQTTVQQRHFTGLVGFEFVPETESTISKIFDQIKVDTATGTDEVPAKLLKDAKVVLVPIVAKLINLSYETFTFPNCLKQARIKPLYKSDDINDPKNYRPISILPTLSKIFERAATNQITKYLEQNNLITNTQHAYRQKHSTQTCLVEVVNYLYKILDKKQIPAVISLDLSKAFDSINHNLLLSKLADLEMSESTIKWVKSYLSNRKQITKFQHFTSEEEEITSGIPQGSILGPLMFVCFTNDFSKSFDASLKIMSYADDTQIIVDDENIENLKLKIKSAIDNAQKWYRENTMKMNVGKTEILIIDKISTVRKFKMFFQIDGKLVKIKASPVIKVLGIKIDHLLNWNSQINYVKKNSINAIRQVHRINNLLPVKHRIQLYNSLVTPHFDYSDIVWGGCGKTNSKRIQIAQNFAVRSITGNRKRDSASASFNKLKFLRLDQRRFLHETVFTHKSLTFQNPSEINNQYLEHLSITDNRQSYTGKLVPPKHNTTKYTHSPLYRTIQAWNSCPSNLPTGNIKQHKTQLHKHMIQASYYKP